MKLLLRQYTLKKYSKKDKLNNSKGGICWIIEKCNQVSVVIYFNKNALFNYLTAYDPQYDLRTTNHSHLQLMIQKPNRKDKNDKQYPEIFQYGESQTSTTSVTYKKLVPKFQLAQPTLCKLYYTHVNVLAWQKNGGITTIPRLARFLGTLLAGERASRGLSVLKYFWNCESE